MPHIESEKKRIITTIPEQINLDFLKKENIQQYYIRHPIFGEVRMRSIDNNQFLITKKYTDNTIIGKVEIEEPITAEEFEYNKHYILKPNHGAITKIRYHLTLDHDLHGELDVFTGVYKGIVFLEIEFDALHPYATFKKPSRVGKNISGVISNKSLFLKGPSIIQKIAGNTKPHPVVKKIKKTYSDTKKALNKLTKQVKK